MEHIGWQNTSLSPLHPIWERTFSDDSFVVVILYAVLCYIQPCYRDRNSTELENSPDHQLFGQLKLIVFPQNKANGKTMY